jgi:hypothetical protein
VKRLFECSNRKTRPHILFKHFYYSILARFCDRQNKTGKTKPSSPLAIKSWAGSKTAFRRGAESSFCLWQNLKQINQKIALSGEDLDFFSEMVIVPGIEPGLSG